MVSMSASLPRSTGTAARPWERGRPRPHSFASADVSDSNAEKTPEGGLSCWSYDLPPEAAEGGRARRESKRVSPWFVDVTFIDRTPGEDHP
jgi:hypothetical protein